jgi:hypothetical protein
MARRSRCRHCCRTAELKREQRNRRKRDYKKKNSVRPHFGTLPKETFRLLSKKSEIAGKRRHVGQGFTTGGLTNRLAGNHALRVSELGGGCLTVFGGAATR